MEIRRPSSRVGSLVAPTAIPNARSLPPNGEGQVMRPGRCGRPGSSSARGEPLDVAWKMTSRDNREYPSVMLRDPCNSDGIQCCASSRVTLWLAAL